MSDEVKSPEERAREESDRRTRRKVGVKVIGETREWAEGVEREAGARFRLALQLVGIIAVIGVIAWLLVGAGLPGD